VRPCLKAFLMMRDWQGARVMMACRACGGAGRTAHCVRPRPPSPAPAPPITARRYADAIPRTYSIPYTLYPKSRLRAPNPQVTRGRSVRPLVEGTRGIDQKEKPVGRGGAGEPRPLSGLALLPPLTRPRVPPPREETTRTSRGGSTAAACGAGPSTSRAPRTASAPAASCASPLNPNS